MFVKSAMIPKHKCYVVSENDSVAKVLEVLEHHQVDGVPVLAGEKYAGVVTRYQIYQGFFNSGISKESFINEKTASDLAIHKDKCIVSDEVFEKTLLDLKEFPLISVVDEKENFLGIVTRFDVLDQFRSAFGVEQKGVRIAFTSVETEGRIARLGDIIQQFHESVISLVTFDDSDKLLRRIVLKVEQKDNIDKFIKKLEKSGFRVLDIYKDE